MSEYGEPWTEETALLLISGGPKIERAVACVNACAGFDDPQEMRRTAVAMKILENHNAGYAITLRESTESSEADVPTLLNVVSVLAVARRFQWPEIEVLEEK